jgi:hypothetical protein
MAFPHILLLISLISNVIAYSIYIGFIVKNKIKPHGVTYLVWAIILGLNFTIQLTSGVGISSLLLGLNVLGCCIVFTLCYKKGYVNYDRLDWLCFALAIFAITLWLITKTPIYSVILSCLIDLLALLPSFRKSFKLPWDDSPIAYWTSGAEYLISLPSYQIFSLVTLLYPVCLITLDFTYSIFIMVRRFQLKKSN